MATNVPMATNVDTVGGKLFAVKIFNTIITMLVENKRVLFLDPTHSTGLLKTNQNIANKEKV